MSKGLEALESICIKGCGFCDLYYYEHNKRCKEKMRGCENCIFCGEEHDIVEKELTALKIIKDFISLEPHCIYGKARRNLTEEEYELLKEVLKNE